MKGIDYKVKSLIDEGKISIGIEFGSTRIKAVMTDEKGHILATGGVNWENQLKDNIWIYEIEQVHKGLQDCYADLSANVKAKYNTVIKKANVIGISGMMHGYIALDKEKNVLAPFRTWRNNITYEEASYLTKLFNFNIPQRWSVTHLYQAVLNKEHHLNKIDYLTTLSGYIHYLLTGEKVLGICDASGMFPIDSRTKTYNKKMAEKFNSILTEKGYSFSMESIFPKVLCAGEAAGRLTEKGANLIDISGNLEPGSLLCPPEGDGGTGMVSTNSVRQKTGNISAGTSAFAMLVLEKELSSVYEEIDVIQTPNGSVSAMVHSNNCTTEINCWVSLFGEALETFGCDVKTDSLYETLFNKAVEGDADCGGLMAYGFHSGEHLLNLSSGCPLFLHEPNAKFNLANFMRTQIYTSFGVLKKGLDILKNNENLELDKITAHGGLFKTKGVAQNILSSAINTPVAVNNAANEGGAWGIAVLACYLKNASKMSLEDFLDTVIFKEPGAAEVHTVNPVSEVTKGFEDFMKTYDKYLKAEYVLTE